MRYSNNNPRHNGTFQVLRTVPHLLAGVVGTVCTEYESVVIRELMLPPWGQVL